MGVVHTDTQGEERLLYLFDQIAPEFIAVEFPQDKPNLSLFDKPYEVRASAHHSSQAPNCDMAFIDWPTTQWSDYLFKNPISTRDLDTALDEFTGGNLDTLYEKYQECTEIVRSDPSLRAMLEAREKYMAARIHQIYEKTGGPVIVICGISHMDALAERMEDLSPITTRLDQYATI